MAGWRESAPASQPTERKFYVIYDCDGAAHSVAAGAGDRGHDGRLHPCPPGHRHCGGFAPGHLRPETSVTEAERGVHAASTRETKAGRYFQRLVMADSEGAEARAPLLIFARLNKL